MTVHLHVRSAFSLLKSTLTIEKIIQNCKKHGYWACALSDLDVMHGAISFYQQAKKAGIHPIIGMEILVEDEEEKFGFVILAKNDQGYQDLCALSTKINTYERKRISIDELTLFSHHCILISAGSNDSMEQYILKENREKMGIILNKWKEYFQDIYVGIAKNDSPLFKEKNQILKSVAQEIGLSTVALSRIYYGDEKEQEAYQCLCGIDQGLSIDDKTLDYSPRRFFRSPSQMEALYDEEDLKNSDEIAKQCIIDMHFERASLPKYVNQYHIDSGEFLRQLCFKGLQKRMNYQNIPYPYIERLQYELKVILSMGYENYFLIVWDFIRFAKQQDIFIGPGRGSAAGSLVSYCLGITHIDPLKYNLLFERFLNPERVSMPDIDTDFPDDRRDEVIEYVYKKYGYHHVAHIVTFNTLGAKQVLRDVGRVYQIPLRQVDLLCKLVPNRLKITLKDAYDETPRFKQMINSSAQLKHIFQIALQLEGLPRHTSMHAAGIVLSDDDISKVCPLIELEEGLCTTQYTMEYLEDLGLIKMDFLGLRNLTIIHEIVANIQRKHPKFQIMKIPLNDSKTYQLLCKVDTMGVFQLESEGIKSLIRKMQPKCFEDVVATIALFRPGPMENIPAYLEYREHPEKVKYIHPDLENILKPTYGVMIYQEQIMQVAQKMAGFSLGKADILRKAISKKKSDQLQQLEDDFINGSIQKGYSKQLAKEVYDLIMKFANYGFNRSHSVAYGLLAYQLAYLKANAPLYFFHALLNGTIHSESKTSAYIFEAKSRGIMILKPSINHSGAQYMIEDQALRYPLLGIKEIGNATVSLIIKERNEHGLFIDFFDFVARMLGKRINKKTIETLIYAGALDCFKINRSSLYASLDDAIRYGDLVKIEDEDQVQFDYNLVSKPAMTMVKDNAGYIAQREKEALGFYLSNHPIISLRKSLPYTCDPLISLPKKQGQYVHILSVLKYVKPYRTKNGAMMCFAVGEDESANFDLVIMPNLYEIHKDNLKKGQYLYCEGIVDKPTSCLIKKMKLIKQDEDNIR